MSLSISLGAEDGGSSQLDRAFEKPPSRYVIGIDLGTTNCAVGYVDTEANAKKVETFSIEQRVDWSLVEKRDTLPSFHYQLTEHEKQSIPSSNALDPSHPYVVGALARDRGLQMPGRQIASAKSWLCHDGVDRSAPMLPWHGDEDVRLLSPVEASAAYLRHIREAWNHAHRQHLMEDQDVIITLPASFDEIARELTVQAAKLAGLPRVLLVEEPQAAFYAWLHRHGESWSSIIQPGQSVLICDIGGGTTDFTLIRVKKSHRQTNDEFLGASAPDVADVKLQQDPGQEEHKLHRVAVGQHLILGGDNLDLALARACEQKLGVSKPLPPRDWDSLRLHCRVAKETLLGPQPPQEYILTLSGAGSKLISQTRSLTLDHAMVREVLLDGFFPIVKLRDRAQQNAVGFQEFGLPYAQDAAITRHMASFLWDHRFAGREEGDRERMTDERAARPDFILFNGGVLEAEQIRSRILEQLEHWFQEEGQAPWKIQVLEGTRLDLAVAQGAAYFGMVRRGEGVRIDASLARSYYLQIQEDPPRLVCLVPGDTQTGDTIRLDQHPFELMLGQPVQFPLWVSSTRLTDPSGTILEVEDEQFKPMPPIKTVLESARGRKMEPIPVVMEAELTEIGTLLLACAAQDGSQRWKLDFDVRSTVETDRQAHLGMAEQAGIVSDTTLSEATALLEKTFGDQPTLEPRELLKAIADAVGMPRGEWPPSLLRGMWSKLIDLDEGRRHSAQHESRWINLVGYCLRPGYGYAADDWRVATTWRKVQGKLRFRAGTSADEAIILWRRIAGGFSAGQQQALYQEIAPRMKVILSQDAKSIRTNEAMELLRLAGSLELLALKDRTSLAKSLLHALARKKLSTLHSAMAWTLGRVGCRVPMYGPIHQLLPSSQVESWMETLLALELPVMEKSFALMQWSRRTGDRYRDVGASTRDRVVQWMVENRIGEHTIRLVRDGGELTTEERSTVFGESMPLGLRLRRDS